MSDNQPASKNTKSSLTINPNLFWKHAFTIIFIFGLIFAFLDYFFGIRDLILNSVIKPFLPDIPSSSKEMNNFYKDLASKSISIFLLAAFVAWLAIEKNRRSIEDKLSSDFSGAGLTLTGLNKTVSELSTAVRSVRDRLDDPEGLFDVKFALFDNLLTYAPFYIAQDLGYFHDEGLDVTPEYINSDTGIANLVRFGGADFGICDPALCLKEESSISTSNDLLILFPLVKRFGFKVFGRVGIFDRIEKGESINIGTYSEGTTSFISAQALARDIGKWASKKNISFNISEKITIVSFDVTKDNLDTISGLEEFSNGKDLILLWEPQSSWMASAESTTLSSFGQLVRNVKAKDQLKIQGRFPPNGNAGWRSWVPLDTSSCLVSAVVVTREFAKNQPALCRRVFKAFSRSAMLMHGVDWMVDQGQDGLSIHAKIKNNIKISDPIDAWVFRNLVHSYPDEVAADMTSGGLYPFIFGELDSQSRYNSKLRNTHMLWHQNKGLDFPPKSANTYAGYFVQFDRT